MERIAQSFADASAGEKYDVVYLNTPWKKLSQDELASLPIGDICKADSTLFLWADSFTVASATDLIQKYGFQFKSVASILNLAEKPPASQIPAPIAPAVIKLEQEQEEEAQEGGEAACVTVVDVTGPETLEQSVPASSSGRARGPRVKSIQPPSWWGSSDCISRPTTEQLFMAVRGAGAALHSKFKAQPYQVRDMPELAKMKARGRQASAWCPEEWFFRRPSDFLESVVHSMASDCRIIELFGDSLHDTVHSLGPGIPLGYVPPLASEEGVVAVAKSALESEGKVALRSLAAKLRRMLTVSSVSLAAPEEGEIVGQAPEVDPAIKIALDKAMSADQRSWPDSIDLQRVFSSCADYKLANQSSRSRKHKRSERSKINADGTPVKRYGIAAPTPISAELCAFLGEPEGSEIARTSVVQRINIYIKENNLKDGRLLKMDDKMKTLLKPVEGQDVTFFTVCRLLSPHILKRPVPEGTPETEGQAKKAKIETA